VKDDTIACQRRPLGFLLDENRGVAGRARAWTYRDGGLATVAGALEISTADFDPELGESIKRGVRYLFLKPQSSAVA
jgi:hypothetical protein